MLQRPIGLADILYGLGFTPYDAANPAGFVTAQNVAGAFGFTPVRQGTGAGQLGNVVKIGWSGSDLKATVDVTDLGPFAFQAWVAGRFATADQLAGALAAFDGGTF